MNAYDLEMWDRCEQIAKDINIQFVYKGSKISLHQEKIGYLGAFENVREVYMYLLGFVAGTEYKS